MRTSLETLKPSTRWLGRECEFLAETDSTNVVAESLAGRGAPDGMLVLADRQSAGRGRLGRSFFSPPGVGVYLSAILRPPNLVPEHAHHHVFAAAVAVAECAAAVPELADRVEIKWPNDVLLAGLKTSGINLSVQLDPESRVGWLVLGVGVNVNTPRDAFPPELRGIATSLAATSGHPLDRTRFAEELIERLETWLDVLRAGGFDRVLDRWLEFFRMRGEQVRVALGAPSPGPQAAATGGAPQTLADHGRGTPVEGEVMGVDPEGALLLCTSEGTRRVVAGDVIRLQDGA